LSAVFEKEVRYALRNAQLRVMILMPAVVTFALSFGLDPRRRGFDLSDAGAPFEGVRPALGMYYLFVILSSLTSNLFGYDGAGFRAFVLSPAPRRAVLLGKNLAMLCAALAGAVVVAAANRVVYGPQSWRAHLFGALAFLFFAPAFALAGNRLSARYPKRIEFGKRMNASGMAGLLMVPLMIAAAAPVALAVLAGWAAGRPWLGYAILAAFAAVAVASYVFSLGAQGRELERRELDVLEAVARRDES
jgi:ABC-2 type transport system permease protein